MQPKNLLQCTAIASFLLLSAWCILVSNTLPGKDTEAIKKPTFTQIVEDIKIFKIVKTKEISAALAKSKDKKIILNIYPVKLSADMNKTDFDLKVAFQDAGQTNKNLGTKVNSSNFKTQSKWYVSFLKSKEVLGDNIPYGYFIEIDPSLIKKTSGINICIIPEKSALEYCLLPTNVTPTDKQTIKNDSNDKCPPICCLQLQAQIIRSDSIGKCPPDCKKLNLLYENTMKKVISS
jgi:hypothetical protein